MPFLVQTGRQNGVKIIGCRVQNRNGDYFVLNQEQAAHYAHAIKTTYPEVESKIQPEVSEDKVGDEGQKRKQC